MEENNTLYSITLIGFNHKSSYNKYRMNVDIFINKFNISGVNPLLAPNASSLTPYVIADGITLESAISIQEHLNKFDCITEIKETNSEMSKQESLIQSWIIERNDAPKCPRCGSTFITTGQRGFNIVSGLIGSNKTMNRCGKCGYTWQPQP